jgi:hypothetical protein
MNAQSIVIHPMHRSGAPGIDAVPQQAGPVTEPRGPAETTTHHPSFTNQAVAAARESGQ